MTQFSLLYSKKDSTMTTLRFMLRRLPSAALAVALGVAVAACTSPVELDKNAASGAPVESRTPRGQSSVAPVDAGKGGSGALNDGANPANAFGTLPRVIYFDFDSYAVKDEFKPVIEGYAKALSGNRQLKIAIEGHTDERGGREYNLALGQKRAEAVVRALVLLGAQATQVEPVSYGKERPAANGGDEAAWAKNRRAEMKDR
jgi:peptidoglycan-associated lipoprotein